MSNLTFDNKFGMFIHWAPYTTIGLHEQAIARYNILYDEYEPIAIEMDW